MPRIENRQSRAAGTYTTSEVAAPSRGQNEATNYVVTFDLPNGDLNDTTLTVDGALEGSIDGTTWRVFAAFTGWQGGTLGRDGTVRVPSLGWMASDNRALTKVRVRWTQNKTASLGCTLDTEAFDVSSSGRR
jgi:hypothetical protein